MAHPLTAWRDSRGIRKAQMARLLGINWRSVHRIERAQVRPSMRVGTKIESVTAGEVTCAQLVEAFDAARALEAEIAKAGAAA